MRYLVELYFIGNEVRCMYCEQSALGAEGPCEVTAPNGQKVKGYGFIVQATSKADAEEKARARRLVYQLKGIKVT